MKVIDLTHKIDNLMMVFDESERPCIKKMCYIDKDSFNLTQLKLFSHTGTHIDAPLHIYKDGKSLNDLPIDTFIGKAVIVNIEKNTKKISLDLIKKINLDSYDFLIFNTGFYKFFDSKRYLKDYPILEKNAAEYISKSNLKGIGFDLISPDKIDDYNLTNHKILLKQNKIIIENLNNLEGLPKEFILSILPINFDLNDGSPVRAVAII